MEYRSYADLIEAVTRHSHRVPADVDLVVGVPRSGVLPGSVLAIHLNLPFQDVDAFLAGVAPRVGRTAQAVVRADKPVRKVLVVDDSVASGQSARAVRARIDEARKGVEVFFLAVYGTTSHAPDVDLIFEVVEAPRMFEWNMMRHARLENACFDIDGVLCHDPEGAENDDGPAYAEFLESARVLRRSGARIRHLVTSRLEKYRPHTERWLARNGVDYGTLWMLDLPSAEERRRLNAHASFKAKVYIETGADIFVESESRQAQEIANLSQKPVLSIEDQAILWPEGAGRSVQRRHRLRMAAKSEGRARTFARACARAMLGSRNISRLRKAWRRVGAAMSGKTALGRPTS